MNTADDRNVFAPSLAEMFDRLGKEEVTTPYGLAFAITRKSLDDDFSGSEAKLMKACPMVDYEHRIYHDKITDNYMVIRPGVDGRDFLPEIVANWRRLR